jgi:general secretion pathway protein G
METTTANGEVKKILNFEFLIMNFGSFLNRGFKKLVHHSKFPNLLATNKRDEIGRKRAAMAPLGDSGFTLIELLIVLVILSLLAALVGPALVERLKPAKRTVAQSQIEEFMAALDNFYVDNGRYPTNEEGLQALREKPPAAKSWKGPYLKKEVPDDPWGYPYIYRSPGRNGGFEIVSYGADGKEGGEGENADVTSWGDNKK